MVQNKPLFHQRKGLIQQYMLWLGRLVLVPFCLVLGRLYTSAFLQTRFATVCKTVLVVLMRRTVSRDVD